MRRFTRERITLLAAHFFFFLNFSGLILLPKYFAQSGLSPLDIGILMGSFSLSVLLALPAAGLLSEKIPSRTLFIMGAGLMAFPSAAYMAFHNSFTALALLRILQGIGFSCAFGIIGAMVSRDADARERRFLLGVLTVVGISTHALGPALAEYLIRRYGYATFFAGASAFGLAAFLTGFALPFRAAALTGRAAERYHVLPGSTILSVFLGVIFGSVAIYLPLHLAELGVNDSSLFFIPFVMGSLLTWTSLHRYVMSWPDSIAQTVSCGLMILLLACSIRLDMVYVLIMLSLLFGIGYGYLYPALNASFMDANPTREGRANAFFVWSFNLGMFASSLGFGYLSESMGYAGAFMALACLGFLCMATTILWGAHRSAP